MEIVRTDTLFGSKKNIVGSTTADLVLETLGKVYIKTGKSTKTLTEILSEYSKEGNNRKSSEINTEEVSKLLSSEYMENLIIQVLNKKKIFGEFVTVDTVRSKGNYNLPIYFDSKAEAQTILGLSILNKIETQDIVLGQKGVSAGGVCDLTISGGYGGGGISQDVLDSFWEEKEFWIQNQIDSTLEDELISYKSIQQAVSFSGSSIKTITALSQNTEGVISATFTDIPDAGQNQSGLVNYGTQTFYGVKTFDSPLSALSVSGETTLGAVVKIGKSYVDQNNTGQCDIYLCRDQRSNYIHIPSGGDLQINHFDYNGASATSDLSVGSDGLVRIYRSGLRLNNNVFLQTYNNPSSGSALNLVGINDSNELILGNTTTPTTIKSGGTITLGSSTSIPNDCFLGFYTTNSYTGYRNSTTVNGSTLIRTVAMSNTNVFHVGAYWQQSGIKTHIYGEEIQFYLTSIDSGSTINSINGTLNQTGLHIEQGISCKGICDLTLDPVSARIQALEDRIYALEHPNE